MLKGCGRAVPALCSVPPRTRKTMGGAHKKKGRLRCHKRPKSREETPKEGSDSGVGLGGRYRIPLAKTIAISGSIERKGSRTDTKVYRARPQGRALPQWGQKAISAGERTKSAVLHHAANKVRTCHQPEGSQGTGSHDQATLLGLADEVIE